MFESSPKQHCRPSCCERSSYHVVKFRAFIRAIKIKHFIKIEQQRHTDTQITSKLPEPVVMKFTPPRSSTKTTHFQNRNIKYFHLGIRESAGQIAWYFSRIHYRLSCNHFQQIREPAVAALGLHQHWHLNKPLLPVSQCIITHQQIVRIVVIFWTI